MKKILHFLVILLFLGLLLAPIGGIYYLTELEMEQYNDVYVPAVVQKAYGQPLPVERRDMKEFITLSGSFVSTETFFMELPELKNTYSARFLVEAGDYIEDGMLLGYTENGKQEIFSTATGVIREIHLGSTSYIRMDSNEALALRCSVKDELWEILERSNLSLSDKDGRPVELLEIEKTMNSFGERFVYLRLPSGVYGGEAKDLLLYTGKVYTKALVVPNKCLFRLPGDEKTWYVRTVDEEGNALENVQVSIGFSDGEFTCITGLKEGELLDSGYAAIHGED